MKLLGYIRVSSKIQKKGYSMKNQFIKIKDYCKKRRSKLNLVCLLYLLTYFIPILPSGSFFSTLTSTFFWINYFFYIVTIKNR